MGDVPGVDVIFEHIGGSHWNKELTLLNYGGTIVTTGATTGYNVKLIYVMFSLKDLNILGSTQGTRAELEQGLYWMEQGKIKSIIDSEYTLNKLSRKAHTKMLKGKGLFGKIINEAIILMYYGSDPKINSILDEANRLFLQGKLQRSNYIL